MNYGPLDDDFWNGGARGGSYLVWFLEEGTERKEVGNGVGDRGGSGASKQGIRFDLRTTHLVS